MMRARDILLFQLGNRGAIERTAGSWWSLAIGAILVLSAGIARNYDHLDLREDPEWILGPFIASLTTSCILFVFIKIYLHLSGDKVTVKWRQYLSFLCLYWMTSPCAWLYGIPVEAYTDLLTATKWNITFLAVVSIWRVVLMVRALNVLTGASAHACLLAVLLPASAIMFVGSFYKGLALVGIMGGVRLPPHTELLRSAANFTATVSFWLTLILMFAAAAARKKSWRATKGLPWRREKAPLAALGTALLCLVLWASAGIPTQTKVQRNHQLNMLITHEQYPEAIRYASQFNRNDFSSIHYLPPNPYVPGHHRAHRAHRHYQQLLSQLDGSEPAWLREIWIKQYADTLIRARYRLDEADITLIQELPELRAIIEEKADEKQRERLLEPLKETGSEQSFPPLMDAPTR